MCGRLCSLWMSILTTSLSSPPHSHALLLRQFLSGDEQENDDDEQLGDEEILPNHVQRHCTSCQSFSRHAPAVDLLSTFSGVEVEHQQCSTSISEPCEQAKLTFETLLRHQLISVGRVETLLWAPSSAMRSVRVLHDNGKAAWVPHSPPFIDAASRWHQTLRICQ